MKKGELRELYQMMFPEYTRPDEKKKDIFPPKEKDENRVFAKDLMGNKHYYWYLVSVRGISPKIVSHFMNRNLASWLAARGAEVAYIEVNQNRHLQLLLNIYEAAPDGEHYTIDGIDCYLTNEPDKAYQFIIYDCGVMQTPTSIFRDADHRLLCGSVLPYEIPVFHKALSECGSLEVRPVAICVPQEIQEYCMELFGENVQIAAASHDLFAKRVNGQIYRPLVEKYIAGEKRL